MLAGIGRWSWFCDLFTHFRPQFVVLFVAGGLVALWSRRRALLIVAAAGLLLNALHIVRVAYAHDAVAVADGRPVRLVSFNVAFFSSDFSKVAPYLESLQADVISLQEVPTRELANILAGLASYPHHYLEGRAGNYGSMIVSRWPLSNTRVLQLGGGNGMTADVTVVFPDARLRLLSLHAMWPMTSEPPQFATCSWGAFGKCWRVPGRLHGRRRLQRDTLVYALPGFAAGPQVCATARADYVGAEHLAELARTAASAHRSMSGQRGHEVVGI